MAISDYIEPAIKDYATQATATYSAPIDTSKFTGRQFVAGEDPLQSQAINIAQQGVGSYQPFLSAAQAAQQQAAGTVGGLGAFQTGAGGIAQGAAGMTGPTAFQPFMSPYQQQVIDTTLAEYDRGGAQGAQAIRDAAFDSGNFGGGREGAMLGQYDADRLANRAALQAQLLQSGFTQANTLAQQNFKNQGDLFNMQRGLFGQGSDLAGLQSGLAGQQYGLSNFQRQNMGADVSALGSLGALRQGMNQAMLGADQQAAQTAAYEPYGRLSQYGNALTGLAGGVSGQQYMEPQAASPFSTALSTALGVGGLYGKIFR